MCKNFCLHADRKESTSIYIFFFSYISTSATHTLPISVSSEAVRYTIYKLSWHLDVITFCSGGHGAKVG